MGCIMHELRVDAYGAPVCPPRCFLEQRLALEPVPPRRGASRVIVARGQPGTWKPVAGLRRVQTCALGDLDSEIAPR